MPPSAAGAAKVRLWNHHLNNKCFGPAMVKGLGRCRKRRHCFLWSQFQSVMRFSADSFLEESEEAETG